MEYLSISQVSEKWGVSVRRIQTLCITGRIPGATKIVKETIGVGVNEKAVLRFYKTALSFTSISIFPW